MYAALVLLVIGQPDLPPPPDFDLARPPLAPGWLRAKGAWEDAQKGLDGQFYVTRTTYLMRPYSPVVMVKQLSDDKGLGHGMVTNPSDVECAGLFLKIKTADGWSTHRIVLDVAPRSGRSFTFRAWARGGEFLEVRLLSAWSPKAAAEIDQTPPDLRSPKLCHLVPCSLGWRSP
jgi:hypothetical protein